MRKISKEWVSKLGDDCSVLLLMAGGYVLFLQWLVDGLYRFIESCILWILRGLAFDQSYISE